MTEEKDVHIIMTDQLVLDFLHLHPSAFSSHSPLIYLFTITRPSLLPSLPPSLPPRCLDPLLGGHAEDVPDGHGQRPLLPGSRFGANRQ